jgi:hypothetical protein
VQARTVLVLLAGRGVNRVAQYAAGFALLATWGPVKFAGYAAATGVMTWLLALSSGSERGALLMVGSPGGRRFEPLFVWLGLLPWLLALATWLVACLVAPGTAVANYTAAAALLLGFGCATVLVAMWRLRDLPLADVAAFTTIGLGYAVAVMVVVLFDAGVQSTFAVLTATTAVAVVVLTVGLWRHVEVIPRLARADIASAGRTTALLVAAQAVNLATGPIVYAELAGRAGPDQTSAFYVCTVAMTAFGMLWAYLLHLWQPRLSVWQREHPAATRQFVKRLALSSTVAGAVGTLVGVEIIHVLRPAGWAFLAIGVGMEILLFNAVSLASFVLESADDRARARSTISAGVAFVVTALAGWFLIPAGGAFGALMALVAGQSVRAPLLVIARRGPVTPAEPANAAVVPIEP